MQACASEMKKKSEPPPSYLEWQTDSFFIETHLTIDMYTALHPVILATKAQGVVKIVVHFSSLQMFVNP
jgi:CRISPR/Cas system CMR subunit Cmr6 (Cas7 group RAMP superfamily)